MRLVAVSICVIISGCASQPRAPVASDNCLTTEPAGWALLASSPQNAVALKALAKSALTNPPESVEERWYASGSSLLYCRREDWCVAETWEFAQVAGDWQLIDQHSWVCVTTHNNSFKPNLLRGGSGRLALR